MSPQKKHAEPQRSALYTETPDQPKLRVAVVLGATVGPAWLAEILKSLANASWIDLQIWSVPGSPARRLGSRAWQMYRQADHALLKGPLRDIAAPRSLTEALTDQLRISDVDALPRALLSFEPDVLLPVGLSQAPSDWVATARKAAWLLPPEALQPGWGPLHLLPAFLQGEETTLSGFAVQDLKLGRTLLLEPARISVAQLSFSRNAAYQLQKAPAQVLRALRRLHHGEALRTSEEEAGRPPGTFATAALLSRIAVRALVRHVPRLGRRDRWFLAARRGMNPLSADQPDSTGFTTLPTEDGWFWADPYPWSHQGIEAVFYEAYNFERELGEIHALQLSNDLRIEAKHLVLAGPRHFSYPFLFDWDGQPWMLVESAQSMALTLYRCEEFPARWVPHTTLLEGWRIVDATLHESDGRWWLFACVAETPFDDEGREFNDLFLFHADSPLGPWLPHAANPIVSGVDKARPAGQLFVDSGRLIRPNQDSGREYGHRMSFNEVTLLNEMDYEERPLGALLPDWDSGLRGCHTYNRRGDLEVIDGKRLGSNRKKPSRRSP
jgi:hypothetical protein